jgi:hypothetical protein
MTHVSFSQPLAVGIESVSTATGQRSADARGVKGAEVYGVQHLRTRLVLRSRPCGRCPSRSTDTVIGALADRGVVERRRRPVRSVIGARADRGVVERRRRPVQ